MLRLSVAIGLFLLSTPTFAQVRDAGKGLKFGEGCIGPTATLAPRFGTCLVEGSGSRVWCPNGRVFDRSGSTLQPSVARSICGLNQVL